MRLIENYSLDHYIQSSTISCTTAITQLRLEAYLIVPIYIKTYSTATRIRNSKHIISSHHYIAQQTMAAIYYAAHFNTPLHLQPPAVSASLHHAFGTSSHALDLPTTRTKPAKQDGLSATERRILLANGKASAQEESIFFRLPAELRNQIYEELLCPGAMKLEDLARCDHAPYTNPPLYPAILSTCRRIRDEASELLYTSAVFHAHPALLSKLPHFDSPAKPVLYSNVISRIKRWQLSIRLDTDPQFTMEQATAAFSGAEYLEVRVWQSQYHGADCSVLRLFLGIRGVKVAKVVGSTNPQLARWLESRMMQPKEQAPNEICQCEASRRDMRCGQCCRRVNVGSDWFGGKNVWTFGNR